MGTPDQVAQLCHKHDVSFPCLSDPDVTAYRAYGLARGTFAQVMGPMVMLKAMTAALKGNRGAQLGQDVFQMSGTFVIGTDGVIRYCHRNRDASDHPPLEQVLAAIPRSPA